MNYNPKPFENLLKRYLLRQAAEIDKLIDKYIRQLVLQSTRVNPPEDTEFEFRNYPSLSRAVDRTLRTMSNSITGTIQSGIEWAWDLANAKNDDMVARIVRSIGAGRIPQDALARWNQKNLPALEAFQQRKFSGMSLSDRVWDFSRGIKGDLELALDLGIGEGMSADRLARQVKGFLKEPNRLYRRVRDEKGILRLSQAGSNYHPGQGVYRSSYKNAKRLAGTETNIAYRTADYERAQRLDFILGIEVHLSKNHTCLNAKGEPEPFYDICDELQGRYPKDFKFVGWHPHCRCYTTTILPSEDEFFAYLDEMDDNGNSTYEFKNQVTEVPSKMTKWLEENEERIKGAKSLPYWIKDNPQIAISEDVLDKINYEKLKDDLRNQERNGIPKDTPTITDELRQRYSNFMIKGSDEFDFEEELFEKYDSLVKPTADNWIIADSAQKHAMVDYTDGEHWYGRVNAVARKQNAEPDSEAAQKVIDMERFIRGCRTKEEMVFRRGTGYGEIEKVFGEDVLRAILSGDNSAIGQLGVQRGFTSTSFNEFGGYHLGRTLDTKVEMRILAPKGTQAAFAKVFSRNDMVFGSKWGGELPADKIYLSDAENEMILNRNMLMRIEGYEVIDAEKGWIRVLVSILGRV